MEYNIQMIKNKPKYIINANQRRPKFPTAILNINKKRRPATSNITINGVK